MRVRTWIMNSLEGSLVGEVALASSSSFSTAFGGGDCQASISLAHLTTRDGSDYDWNAISRVRAWADGGRYSLIATVGETLLGEWLLLAPEPSLTSGTVSVRGMEWDGYPALRSLNRNYVYKNADMYDVARALFKDAFESYQESKMSLGVPSGKAGVVRSLNYKSHTAYYGDLIDEIADSEGGFDWKIRSALTWQDGVPVRVTRSVVFGRPVLNDGPVVAARFFGVDSSAGNVLQVSGGGRDSSAYAQSVYGWGAGEGGKQKWVGVSDPALTNNGWPIMTRNVTFNGVKDDAVLRAKTAQVLADSQAPAQAYAVDLLIERTDGLPVVGGRLDLACEPSPAYPDGISATYRVGEVSYSLDGHETDKVSIQAA